MNNFKFSCRTAFLAVLLLSCLFMFPACPGEENPPNDTDAIDNTDESVEYSEESDAVDTAPDTTDADIIVSDPCEKLYVIERKWCETQYSGTASISLNIDWPNDTCIVSVLGENIGMKKGTFYGKKLPLIAEGGGWYEELRMEGIYLVIEIAGPGMYTKEYFLPC